MKVFGPSVVCPHCHDMPSVILLPYPNPPRIFSGQPVWPLEKWKANIACHECGLVSEYSAQDVHWGAHDSEFLNQLHARQVFGRLDTVCAGAAHEFPIPIYVYAGSGTTADDVIRKLYEHKFEHAKCPEGHGVNSWERKMSYEPIRGPI